MDYENEENASASRLPRQITQDIGEESGLDTQNTGAFRQTTSGIPESIVTDNFGVNRQMTEDIMEDSMPQKGVGPGSLVSLPEADKEMEEDVASETKTISQSRSQAVGAYRIESKGSNLIGGQEESAGGTATSKDNAKLLEKKEAAANKLKFDNSGTVGSLAGGRHSPGVLTVGTAQETQKSGVGGSDAAGNIIQDKENIILSQLSSKNTLDRPNE